MKLVSLPEDCGVNGIDDLLMKWGPSKVLKLFDTAVSGARLRVIPSPQFQSTPDGISRTTTKGDVLMQVNLTNFAATIVTNIELDDGVEAKREFEIQAELLGTHHRFIIPASEFVSMNWAVERMGATAIVFPNQKDYARAAIQSLSLTATEQRIYTHTGWREIHGGWAYLHAGGAISASGATSETDVRLWGTLNRYHLPPPPNPGEIKLALAATFRLLELAPPSISFPLLAATFRAVIGNTDFSLHLAGATGTFKSEIAALHQRFFGAGMKRMHLPGSWSSTANALEALSFYAKDALLVIDDFAPQGSGVDVARYHSAADRVFRAVGNQAGRGRLDSTAKLRESKPPRALILSTGEEIPRGQSVRARLLILEISKGEISASTLTGCQRDASDGLYAECMAGFLQWVAGRYVETRTAFDAKVSEYRTKAVSAGVHARTPDIVASLQAAFDFYLQFAVASGAIDTSDAENLSDRCWNALGEAAAAQAKHQGETEPAVRFLSRVRCRVSCRVIGATRQRFYQCRQ